MDRDVVRCILEAPYADNFVATRNFHVDLVVTMVVCVLLCAYQVSFFELIRCRRPC